MEGCEWRAYRKWDLAVHLGAEKGHGMVEGEVAGVLGIYAGGDAVGEQDGEMGMRDEDMGDEMATESESESDGDWSVASDHESDCRDDNDYNDDETAAVGTREAEAGVEVMN